MTSAPNQCSVRHEWLAGDKFIAVPIRSITNMLCWQVSTAAGKSQQPSAHTHAMCPAACMHAPVGWVMVFKYEKTSPCWLGWLLPTHKANHVYSRRRPKGFAFVEFKDNRDAEDALSGLDRSIIGGREITVSTRSSQNLQSLKMLSTTHHPVLQIS